MLRGDEVGDTGTYCTELDSRYRHRSFGRQIINTLLTANCQYGLSYPAVTSVLPSALPFNL
jgi:hypothetical protein